MFLSTHEIFRKLDHILRDKSQQFSKNLNNKNSIFSHDIHKKLSNDGGGDKKREEGGWEGVYNPSFIRKIANRKLLNKTFTKG